MTESTFQIAAGDYARAGLASKGLKEQLKKIGTAPEVLRRVMIAAYEAEMNVVIHAWGGVMKAVLDDRQLSVEVIDEGPGIPDVELAMTEGFSTAPAKARELGFGAGLGLPNIRRNADRFQIDSGAGRGTRVSFTVFLRPQESVATIPGSLTIRAEKCTRCLRCLHVCPTRAIRARANGPQRLDHLCVDCACCIEACPAGSLTLEGTADELTAAADRVLVVPDAVLAQLGPQASGADVLAVLRGLGFADVIVTQAAEAALLRAVTDYAAAGPAEWPVIAACCPAVINLIETRFPALIRNVAPFPSPMEALRDELLGQRDKAATFVVLCPAQKTLLAAATGRRVEAILPAVLLDRVRRLLPSRCGLDAPAAGIGQRDQAVRITGMAHVVRALEEIENSQMPERWLLELYACDGGCFGSPLLPEDPYVAERRYRPTASGQSASPAAAGRRNKPLAARAGLRLDGNMAKAIEKLARIDRLLRELPGEDCGACGCPSCASLAEDVVMGRTGLDSCTRMRKESQ